jgi:hypothetical protein
MARFRRDRPPMPPRLLALFVGVGVGAIWGLVLFGIGLAIGNDYTAGTLGFLVLTCGMIGGGAASFLGAINARKRGERVMPKGPYRRSKGG